MRQIRIFKLWYYGKIKLAKAMKEYRRRQFINSVIDKFMKTPITITKK